MKPLPFALALALAAVAATAKAQEPTAFAGAWPLAPNPQLAPRTFLLGEPTGAPALSPWVASVPLRLSLQTGMIPMAGLFPNCATREGASGNSFHGWPVQRYALLPLTPNLVLHGFSSAGCPVDGAIGGGATYAAPLGKQWWLVAAGGIYGTSSFSGLPARTRGDVRVDLMKAHPDGTSVSVGVGRHGISIGGSW